MTRRSSSGLSFETPDRWSDRSMVIVVAPPTPEGGMAANIVVAREERRVGEGLDMHVRRQLEQTATRYGQITVLENGPIEVAGRPAFKLRFRASTPAGVLEQIVVYVDLRDPKWVTTMTASGAAEGIWGIDFERMIRGARLDASLLGGEKRTLGTTIASPPSGFPPSASLPVADPSAPWIPMPGERSSKRY